MLDAVHPMANIDAGGNSTSLPVALAVLTPPKLAGALVGSSKTSSALPANEPLAALPVHRGLALAAGEVWLVAVMHSS